MGLDTVYWIDSRGNLVVKNHSDLVSGQEVDGAFTLWFDELGTGSLKLYSPKSGHYTTENERLPILEYSLQKSKVDISKAKRTRVDIKGNEMSTEPSFKSSAEIPD